MLLSAHFLVDEKLGQVSTYVNPPKNSPGAKRAVFNYAHGTFKFAGYTDEHNYTSIPNHGASDFYQHYENHEKNFKVMNGQICVLACKRTLNSDDDVDQEDWSIFMLNKDVYIVMNFRRDYENY